MNHNHWARIFALFTMAIGVTTWLAWILDAFYPNAGWLRMTAWWSGTVSQKEVTAQAFILLGFVLWENVNPSVEKRSFRHIGFLSVGILVLMGLPLIGVYKPIQMFGHDPGEILTVRPGTPSDATQVVFATWGSVALLASVLYSYRVGFMLIGASVSFLIAGQVFTGYLLSVPSLMFYHEEISTGIAFQTALAFLFASCSSIICGWSIVLRVVASLKIGVLLLFQIRGH